MSKLARIEAYKMKHLFTRAAVRPASLPPKKGNQRDVFRNSKNAGKTGVLDNVSRCTPEADEIPGGGRTLMDEELTPGWALKCHSSIEAVWSFHCRCDQGGPESPPVKRKRRFPKRESGQEYRLSGNEPLELNFFFSETAGSYHSIDSRKSQVEHLNAPSLPTPN